MEPTRTARGSFVASGITWGWDVIKGDPYRPFEILKLIRDGRLARERDLYTMPDSGFLMAAGRLLTGLERLGLVERTADGGVMPTERLNELLATLDASLTQLSPYTRRNTIVCAPVFGQPVAPPIRSDVFVLMPFAEDLRPVYEDHIATVVRAMGLSVARADDFFGAGSVISDVWNAVSGAAVIVADCTGRNPNVFYELGIAHTLGKNAILIAQSATDIPFDLRHIRTILYEFTPRGMKQFEEQLTAAIQNERRWPDSLEGWLALTRG